MNSQVVTAFVAIAGVAAVFTLAVYHISPDKSQEVYQVTYEEQVSTPKSDMIRMIPISAPTRVKTISVSPPLAPEVVERPVPSPTSERRHRVSNICERTGGWKIETRNGRSWHCQYRRG